MKRLICVCWSLVMVGIASAQAPGAFDRPMSPDDPQAVPAAVAQTRDGSLSYGTDPMRATPRQGRAEAFWAVPAHRQPGLRAFAPAPAEENRDERPLSAVPAASGSIGLPMLEGQRPTGEQQRYWGGAVPPPSIVTVR